MSRQKAPVTLPAEGCTDSHACATAGAIFDGLNDLVEIEWGRARNKLPYLQPTQRIVVEQMFKNIADRVGNGPVKNLLNSSFRQGHDAYCTVAQQMFCTSKEH